MPSEHLASQTPTDVLPVEFTSTRVTIKQRLADTGNRPSGFDYMRIILAAGVIAQHAPLITLGKAGQDAIWASFPLTVVRAFAILAVPMFFSISGFLVAGSQERSKTLISFFGLRVIRLVPALAGEVLLSALILGPIFTTVPLSSYFSDGRFFLYFLNLAANIHNSLPGLFENNPLQEVNGQLWTVPFEAICYILTGVFTIIGIIKRPTWLVAVLLICYSGQAMNTVFRPHDTVTGATGSTVIMSFLAGVIVYKYRDRLWWSFWVFLVTGVVSTLLCMIPNGVRFAPLPAAYMTVYLGLLNPGRNRILNSGDYSYSIYLYGFPIQQAFYAIDPLFRLWFWNFLASFLFSSFVAYLSWNLVEKPALRLRSQFKMLEDWCLNNRTLAFLRMAKP